MDYCNGTAAFDASREVDTLLFITECTIPTWCYPVSVGLLTLSNIIGFLLNLRFGKVELHHVKRFISRQDLQTARVLTIWVLLFQITSQILLYCHTFDKSFNFYVLSCVYLGVICMHMVLNYSIAIMLRLSSSSMQSNKAFSVSMFHNMEKQIRLLSNLLLAYVIVVPIPTYLYYSATADTAEEKNFAVALLFMTEVFPAWCFFTFSCFNYRKTGKLFSFDSRVIDEEHAKTAGFEKVEKKVKLFWLILICAGFNLTVAGSLIFFFYDHPVMHRHGAEMCFLVSGLWVNLWTVGVAINRDTTTSKVAASSTAASVLQDK